MKKLHLLWGVALVVSAPASVLAQDAPVTFTAVQGPAAGATHSVLLAWTPATTTPLVTVVRHPSHVPTNSSDGTVIYTGSAVSTTDSISTPGTYYYAAFGQDSGQSSAPAVAAQQGLVVSASNLPAFFDAASVRGASCIGLRDGDADGTLGLDTSADRIQAVTRAAAVNGELDALDLCLPSLSGQFALELDVRMPSRLDDSWSLLLYPHGSGGAWTAIYRDAWRSHDAGWVTLKDTLQAGRTYKFSFVVDSTTGTVSFYVDGVKAGDRNTRFTAVTRLRIANYGYSTYDQTYEISGVKWLDSWPAYHVPPPLEVPRSGVAVASPTGVNLSWAASLQAVRVVRKANGYPTSSTDGTIVYEGSARSYSDAVAPGTYYYSLFAFDGTTASAGANIGSSGTTVVAGRGTRLLSSASARAFTCAAVADGDRDATLVADELSTGAYQMTLLGAATNGEQDYVNLCLDQPLTGRFAIEMSVRTPSRLDQGWNLQLYPHGSGGVLSAFRQDEWLQNEGTWRQLFAGLEPNRTYKISIIVDGSTGLASFYLDESKMMDQASDFRTMTRLRVANYGYGTADLVWQISDINLSAAWPAYHVPPPIEPPVSGHAVGAAGGAAIAWTKGLYATRVVRKLGGYPAHATDGTTVYEGTGTSLLDTVGPGHYYYALFAIDGARASLPAPLGASGTAVSATGRSSWMASNSERTFSCLAVHDPDGDSSFVATESGTELNVALRGAADSNERDHVRLCLDREISGLFTVEVDVTTPARLDQSWSLVINPRGQGRVWTAFSQDRWRVSSSGWVTLSQALAPSTQYQLTMAVNTGTGVTSFYIDGQLLGHRPMNFRAMTSLEIHNYGYADVDLEYALSGLSVRSGMPAFHQGPPLEPPASAYAVGVVDGVGLTWTDSLHPVRVLRRDDRYPLDPTDGTIVYEGGAASHVDQVSAGHYYYSVFTTDLAGGFSPPSNFGRHGVRRASDGRAEFLGPTSDALLSSVVMTDADGDGSLQLSPSSGTLEADLSGAAASGEQDRIDYVLDRRMNGLFTFAARVKMPSRVDQSWGLLIYPYGAGGAWTAFAQDTWRVSSRGWVSMPATLAPNQTYEFSVVVNGTTGVGTFYVDGVRMTDRHLGFTEMTRLRIANYGHATADLQYVVDNVAVTTGAPSYHVPPALIPPATVAALGVTGGAALAWDSVNYPVKVVRRADRYPTSATDGVVVFEGVGTRFVDVVAPGHYYYTVYSTDGQATSIGVNAGSSGTAVTSAGSPVFDSASDGTPVRIHVVDSDHDGSLQVDEQSGTLQLHLDADARNGELDYLQIDFDRRRTGNFAVEIDVTLPDRVDQSWGLVVEPRGVGNSWTAFNAETWQAHRRGWFDLATGLRPGSTHRLGIVADGVNRVVAYYLDGQYRGSERGALAGLDALRLANYGYAVEDLVYSVSRISVLENWPGYHVPPALDAPAGLIALGGQGGSLLTWSQGLYDVRVLRKAGGYSSDATDGAVVYEGAGTSFLDTIPAGRYFYSAFTADGTRVSAGTPGGAQGTTVQADGRSQFTAADSQRTFGCARLTDGDRNGTFKAREHDGGLHIDLLGAARSGEQDRVELCLNQPIAGDFSVEMTVTMPTRVDQSWNLQIEPRGAGSGNLWTAFRDGGWYVSSGGWNRIYQGLAAGATYELAMVVDSVAGVVSFYVDGVRATDLAIPFTGMDALRFGNYGYGTDDLHYIVDDVRILQGAPAYHTPSAVEAPVAVAAAPTPGGVLLTWPAPLHNVRIMRKAGTPPAHAQDGDLVFEGRATSIADMAPAGAYYYKLFSASGTSYSSGLPVGSQTQTVVADGKSGLLSASSERTFNCAQMNDGDRDGTFSAYEESGGMLLALAAEATSGEGDGATFCLDQPMRGAFAIELDVTTPDVIPDSWSLIINPHGQGRIWTAIYRDTWRVLIGGSWQVLATGLAPSTTYRMSMVQAASTSLTSFYLDGVKVGDFGTGFVEMSRFKVANYGYSSVDLTYRIDDLAITSQIPSFHQPPGLNAANALAAVGVPSGVALAWPPPVNPVRIVRTSGSYSSGPSDGVVVYEGGGNKVIDVVPPGRYYYTGYDTDGTAFSAPVHAGAMGSVAPSGVHAPVLDPTSALHIVSIDAVDSDRDASFRMSEVGGALQLDLAGSAANGEQDRVYLRLSDVIRGDFFVRAMVRTPARMDQNWSLQLTPGGAGSALTAFYRDTLRQHGPGGWMTLASGLTANTNYEITWVAQDGILSVYLDGQKVGDRRQKWTRLDWMWLGNYGYAAEDLSFQVSELGFSPGVPAFHVAPLPRSPSAAFALGSLNGVAIGAAEGMFPVRVVRKTGGFPSGPTDGTVVFEGSGDSFNDVVPSGSYHYSLFQWDGATYSAATHAGDGATVASVSGHAASFDPSSDRRASCARMVDYDQDGSLQISETGDELVVDLDGDASSGESDFAEICLERPVSGTFAIEMDVTTPDRLDQQWGLIVNPRGNGGLWTAIYANSWRRNYGGVWTQVFGGMQPNTTYRFSAVVDGPVGTVTWYVDGRPWWQDQISFPEMSRLRLGNYGYASADQTYRIGGIKVVDGLPEYHVRPGLFGQVTVRSQPERIEYDFSSRNVDWRVRLFKRFLGSCTDLLYDRSVSSSPDISGVFAGLSPGGEYCWQADASFDGQLTTRRGWVRIPDLPTFTAGPSARPAPAPNTLAVEVQASSSMVGSGQVQYAAGPCTAGLQALQLDGNDQVSFVGPLLGGRSDFTWIGWVRTSASNQTSTIFSGDGGGVLVGVQSGRPYFDLHSSLGIGSVSSPVPITVGEWVMLAATYDGATMTLMVSDSQQLYTRGRAAMSGAVRGLAARSAIGATTAGWVGDFGGGAVSREALSAADLRVLLRSGPNPVVSKIRSPEAVWPLIEGRLVQSVYDASGHHHAGVLGTTEAGESSDPGRTASLAQVVALGSNRTDFAGRLTNFTGGAENCFVVQVDTHLGTIVSRAGPFKRVIDTTPPAISSVLPIVSLPCASQSAARVDIAALGGVAVRDDQDANPVLEAHIGTASGPVINFPYSAPLGRTVLVWVATDAAGNTDTVKQELVVQDRVAPSAVAGPPLVVEASSPGGTPVSPVPASMSDSCMQPAAPSVQSSGLASYPLGDTSVDLRVSDSSGNSVTVTRVVRVVDSTAPVFDPPLAPLRLAHDGAGCMQVALPQPIVRDDGYRSADISVTLSGEPACWTTGSHTVTWTATDPAGNSVSGTQRVDVSQGTLTVSVAELQLAGAPVASGQYHAGPVTLIVDVGAGTAPYSVSTLPAGAVQAISSTRFAVTFSDEGAYENVLVTATDSAQELGSITAPAFGIDLTPPVIRAGLFSQVDVVPADPTTFPLLFEGESAALERIVASDAPYEPSDLGAALVFDGADDLVLVSSLGIAGPISDVTMSTWVKPGRISDAALMERRSGAGQPVLRMGMRADGRPTAELRIDGVSVAVTAAQSVTLHRWHHLAVTYDGRVVRLMLDGRAVAQRYASGPIDSTTAPLSIGAEWTMAGVSAAYAGEIAAPALHQVARSQRQIREEYRGGIARPAWTDTDTIFALDLSGAGQSLPDLGPAGAVGMLGSTGAVAADDPTRRVLTVPPAPGSSGLVSLQVTIERVDGLRSEAVITQAQAASGAPLAAGFRTMGGQPCNAAAQGPCTAGSLDLRAKELMEWDLGQTADLRLVIIAQDAAGNEQRVTEYLRTRTLAGEVAAQVALVSSLRADPLNFFALAELDQAVAELGATERYHAMPYLEGAYARGDQAARLLRDGELLGLDVEGAPDRLVRAIVGAIHADLTMWGATLDPADDVVFSDAQRYVHDAQFFVAAGQSPLAVALARTSWARAQVLSPELAAMRTARRTIRARWNDEVAAYAAGNRTLGALQTDATRVTQLQDLAVETRNMLRDVAYPEISTVLADPATLERAALLQIQDVVDRASALPNEEGDLVVISNPLAPPACLDRLTTLTLGDDAFARCYLRLNDLASLLVAVQPGFTPTDRWRAGVAEALINLLEITLVVSPTGIPWLSGGVTPPAQALVLPDAEAAGVPGAIAVSAADPSGLLTQTYAQYAAARTKLADGDVDGALAEFAASRCLIVDLYNAYYSTQQTLPNFADPKEAPLVPVDYGCAP